MISIKVTYAVVLAAIFSFAFVGCGQTEAGQQQSADLQSVNMSVPAKSLIALPNYIGVEKGFYRDEGIALDIQTIKPSAAVAAAISGEVPYTLATGSSMQSAITGGSEMKIIMITFDGLAFSLFGAKNIQSVRDLEGTPVMVTNKGATDHYALSAILADAGLDPNAAVDVLSAGTTANSWSALAGGGAQGAVLSPPFIQLAEREGFNRLEDANNVLQRQNGGIAVKSSYLESEPQEVERVVRATLKSLDYIQTNEEETIDFISDFFELEPEVAQGAYDYIIETGILSEDGMVDEELLKSEIEDIKRQTGSRSNAGLEELVDFNVVQNVSGER